MGGEKKATNGSLALDQNRVIVIQPAERAETQKLRMAAYARVSTDSTDQANSFLAQMEHYQRMIATNENWTLADVYADRGISGTSAEKRTDFQRMLSDCRQGRIDKILVKSISRFARNTKECLEIVRELKAIGVGVCFEEQNIDTGKDACPVVQIPEGELEAAFLRLYHKLRWHGGDILIPMLRDLREIRRRKLLWSEDIVSLNKQISEMTD